MVVLSVFSVPLSARPSGRGGRYMARPVRGELADADEAGGEAGGPGNIRAYHRSG